MAGMQANIRTAIVLVALGIALPLSASAADDEGYPVDQLMREGGERSVDHRQLGQIELDSEDLDVVRALGMVIGHCPEGHALLIGLRELAEAEPERFSLRFDRTPNGRWLSSGGLGNFQVGSRKHPEERVEVFEAKMTRRDFAADVDMAAIAFNREDISPGRRVEFVQVAHRVRMDIKAYSVSLADVFTENITAQRAFTVGQGGAVFTGNYPLELPNVSVVGVQTSVVGPAGGGGGRPSVISELTTRPVVSSRYPPLAFQLYRESMDRLESQYPDSTFVWTTVPLARGDNLQRNLFNHYVRRYTAGDDDHPPRPLLDIAAILTHDEYGPNEDAFGPVLSSSWQEAEAPDEINAAGRQRLAQAWWLLASQLTPQTAAVE